MGKLTVLALRTVLVLSFAGLLFVQLVLVPLLWIDMDEADADVLQLRIPFLGIIVLGIVTIEVTIVCVWRLLTMVRRGTVFSHAAFTYVNVVIGAILVAALLTFGMAVVLASTDVAPGLVGVVCGMALMTGGVALIVVVLRQLLAQAVERETEARRLRDELNEVI